jgi:hypothetical protein
MAPASLWKWQGALLVARKLVGETHWPLLGCKVLLGAFQAAHN